MATACLAPALMLFTLYFRASIRLGSFTFFSIPRPSRPFAPLPHAYTPPDSIYIVAMIYTCKNDSV